MRLIGAASLVFVLAIAFALRMHEVIPAVVGPVDGLGQVLASVGDEGRTAMKPAPISASEAKHMLDSGAHVIFVDARNPTAWAQASNKLPDAIRIPADEVNQHLRELPSDGTVVTYCT